MIITQFVKTLYPGTIQGYKMADEAEQKLKSQGCFRGRKEDTQTVIIDSEYRYIVEDEECT